jgi:hypothetical protein
VKELGFELRIYGLKYLEDVRRGKAKNDDYDRWCGMM